jgi:hypothetical protein
MRPPYRMGALYARKQSTIYQAHLLTAHGVAAHSAMTTPEIISTVTSAVSILIAFAAFVTSRRVQRDSYKLQLELSQRLGRLKKVILLYPEGHERTGYGFKVLNGPDEVTVSNAILNMTYRIYRAPTLWRVDKAVEFAIPPQAFNILGLSGKAPGFRLHGYGEAVWRFPTNLPTLLDKTIDGRLNQQIELRLTVTASEDTKTSEPLMLGDRDGPMTLFRARVSSTDYVTLDKVLLGVLARDAMGAIRSASPSAQMLPGLGELLSPGINVPAELKNWLVDAWQQGGSFSDESTEKLARTLLDIKQHEHRPTKATGEVELP